MGRCRQGRGGHGALTTCDLLIRDGLVITMSAERTVLRSGAIAIADGRIQAVGPDHEIGKRFRARHQINARGGIVHPGFIDAHVHPTQHLIRFAFPDTFRYEDTLAFYIDFILALDDDDEYTATLLACLEMARHGTTMFLEGCGSVLEPDAAAAAIDEVGIRGSLGDPYIWDLGGEWSARLKSRIPPDRGRALRLLGGQLSRNANGDSRVRGHVALTGHATASDELFMAATACAQHSGVILNMHQSYSDSDTAQDDRVRGEHPLVHFAEIGGLSSRCTFAHMNLLRSDEIAPVVESGMALVWCPSASMMWGCGGTIMGHHAELYQRGVPVALGSDASNYCGTLDVADQAFLALLTAREKRRRADTLLAQDVLTMSTLHGARAVGLEDDLGSIEVGKLADVVIQRADVPEAAPELDPVRQLVIASRSRGVDTVIVSGEVVVENGRSTRVDESRVYAEARTAAVRLLQRMGRPIEQRWPIEESRS